MKWFKHMSNSHTTEAMAETMDTFGAEAYGVWWILNEVVARNFEETLSTSARFSLKTWAKTCGVSAKKFQKFVEFWAKLGEISVEFSGNYCRVDMPNLLKLQDNWTRDKRRNLEVTSKKLPSIDKEEEKEKEKEEEEEDLRKESASNYALANPVAASRSAGRDAGGGKGKTAGGGKDEQGPKEKTAKSVPKPPPEIKRAYGENGNVLLTDGEYRRLREKYGEERTERAVAFLDLHIGAKGRDEYKNHCLALQKWVFDAVDEREARRARASPAEARTAGNIRAMREFIDTPTMPTPGEWEVRQ